MKMCSRICVQNKKNMRRRILHKNMCTRQTSLHPTIFVSSSFLFIVKDDAARDLIFSDPYITKHSKVFCICKYLSLSPQQRSLLIIWVLHFCLFLCLKGWLSTPYQFVVFAFILSQLFLLSLSLSLWAPSVSLFHCYCYSVCLCLVGRSNAKDYWFTRSLYRLHV